MTAADASTRTPTLTANETTDALASGAVIRWWQTTAFLDVSGDDAVSMLDGLCTQAVGRIDPGTARMGLFLDAKAKIIAPAIVHRLLGETTRLMLETLPSLIDPLHKHLKKYRLRAKATIEPVEHATVAIVGNQAPMSTPPDAVAGDWSRVDDQPWPTLAWIGDPADAPVALAQLGFGHADPDALEAARIERGAAGLHDLLPGRMPAEVGGMESAVALDAGCYLGQEPVARLHYRGHANRTLRRLASDGGADEHALAPAPTTAETPDDDPLELVRCEPSETTRSPGRLTTWSTHPDGHIVALAMLRRDVENGTLLRLAHGSCPPLRALDG